MYRNIKRLGGLSVHTNLTIFRRIVFTLFALVDIFRAVKTFVSSCAGTREGPIYGARVANRTLVTGVRCACVLQVTQQT